jgi:hypothetical protein
VTSHGCMARMPRSVPTKRLLRLPRLTNGLGVTSVESVDRASRPAEPMRVGHLAKAPKRHSGLLATTAYVLSILAANPARAQEPPAVAVDSVRGVPRVVNLARSPADLPQLRLRELWRVGGLDAPPEGQFVGPFFAVVLDKAGRAWVLDNRAELLTLFDARGAFVKTVARAGRGPGDLSYPTGLSAGPGGEVWVEGAIDGYYKVFDADGNLTRTQRQDAHSINGIMRPFRVGAGVIFDHARGYPDIKFFRADTLATPIDSFTLTVPDIATAGILRPGSAAYRVARLRPFLLWTMSTDGTSIWLARTDSLGLAQLSVHGDTIRRVEARHRTPELTAQQLEDIRAARHEMRNPGNFAAVLIQSIHGIDGGRVLVQVGRDPDEPSSEFDLYSPEGVLEGVVHSPIPVHHRSELSSRGDTILFIGVGEYDVPLLVKAVLERWRPHRR